MTKGIFAAFGLLAMTAALVAAAEAQTTQSFQCPYGGLNAVPLVPTAKVAGEIFRAIAQGFSPALLERFPDVTVKDGGDHWTVSQMNVQAAEDRERQSGAATVTLPGRGQLSLTIDKCTGTVLRAGVNP